MLTPYTHHRAILGIFLALGTLDVLYFLKKGRINPLYVCGILVFVAVSQQYLFHLPLNKLIKKEYWQSTPWMADNRALLKTIPNDMSIASTQDLVPHLSHRKEIYLIWPRKKIGREAQEWCHAKECWWLDSDGKPEYMLINVDKTHF